MSVSRAQMPWEETEDDEAKAVQPAKLSAKTRGAAKQALMQRQKQLAAGSNQLAAQLFKWESGAKKHAL
jgi:X-X-X-Leu-X-X-Gly heptad repeat protein